MISMILFTRAWARTTETQRHHSFVSVFLLKIVSMAAVVAVNGADSALALLIFLHHHRRKIVVGSLVFQI